MQSGLMFLLNGPIGNGPAGQMMRGGHMGGGFLFGGLMSVLWTVIIVLAVLWVTRNWSSITSYVRRTASSLQSSTAAGATSQAPLEILQTRYAKGEISHEEYETIRRDLVGEAKAAPTVENIPVQA